MPYEKIGDKEQCIAEQIPFEIPSSWEWVRLGSCGQSIQYGYNAKSKETGRIKMLRISDIQNNNIIYDKIPYCDIKDSEISNYLLKENDILFARTGGTVGKSYLVASLSEDMIYAGYLIRLRLENNISPKYIKFFMESPLYWTQLKNGTIGTAQPNCNGQTLSKMLIPLPPLAEQKRIVEKLEKLLPLVDEYEENYNELEKLDSEFPDKFKKSILQYAIQGKLVEQDPSDEPASVLLEKIRAEKQELIKSGKIKKDKNESFIYRKTNFYRKTSSTQHDVSYKNINNGCFASNEKDQNEEIVDFYEKFANGEEKCINDELPFEIPSSWEWVRLGSCGNWRAGSTPPKTNLEYYGGNIPFLKTGDLNDNYIEDIPEKITELALQKLSIRLNPADTVLIAMYGATIGKIGILKFPATTNQACCACIVHEFLYNKYLFYFLMSMRSKFINMGVGGAQPNISKEKIISTIIPLPPLAEQKRIVAKIEELFKIIEPLIEK